MFRLMTDAMFNSLIVGIPTLLAAVGALAVSIINALKSTGNGKKADILIQKTDDIHSIAKNSEEAAKTAAEVAVRSAEDVISAIQNK